MARIPILLGILALLLLGTAALLAIALRAPAPEPPETDAVANTGARAAAEPSERPLQAETEAVEDATSAEADLSARIAVELPPAPGKHSAGDKVLLFDDFNEHGWVGSRSWKAENGVLYYPPTLRDGESLLYTSPLMGPCEISLDVQLVGRNKDDGRGFWIKAGTNEVHLRLDSAPNEFELVVLPSGPHEFAVTPLEEGHWYDLDCRITADGTVSAFIDEKIVLNAKWQGKFPAQLGLECQRGGGRYRNIRVRYL
jgi:hypothetical protein